MTNAPTSRTSTAERVCVGAVVVPSLGAAREAGENRPLMASDLSSPLTLAGLNGLLALLGLLGGLMQPSSVAPRARQMGGLQGIPVH